MTTIILCKIDEIYIIKCLTYNITNKSYKIDTEKLVENWEKSYFFLSTRVYKLFIHRMSLQEPFSDEDCEHVSDDLNI